MDGKAEAEAFERKEYVKLHQSTLRKVDVLSNIVERTANGSLKTNSQKREVYGNWFVAFFELIEEHPVISGIIVLISFLSAVISFFK